MKGKVLVSAMVFLLVFLVMVPMARAETITLNPTADSLVAWSRPDINFGVDPLFPRLICQRVYIIDPWGNIRRYVDRSYLKFDVKGIVGTICGAVLKLYCDVGEVWPTLDVEARKVTDDTWTETGITWNNQPGFGDLITTTPVGGPDAWYSWDIKSYVVAERGVDGIVSVVMRLPDDDPPPVYGDNYGRRFYSREEETNKPVLEITIEPQCVPEFGANVATITSVAAALMFTLKRFRK